MTTQMVAIVFVVASIVIMSAVSLAIGIRRGEDPSGPDFPLDADGKLSDRRRAPRLRC
jgi:hypothetical protein